MAKTPDSDDAQPSEPDLVSAPDTLAADTFPEGPASVDGGKTCPRKSEDEDLSYVRQIIKDKVPSEAVPVPLDYGKCALD